MNIQRVSTLFLAISVDVIAALSGVTTTHTAKVSVSEPCTLSLAITLLPVLMYGIDVCPTNSADRQSLQFTVNRIIYQIFGAMTKDSCCEISECFGIPTVEQLITNRRDRFLNRFQTQGNYVCQMPSADYVA